MIVVVGLTDAGADESESLKFVGCGRIVDPARTICLRACLRSADWLRI